MAYSWHCFECALTLWSSSPVYTVSKFTVKGDHTPILTDRDLPVGWEKDPQPGVLPPWDPGLCSCNVLGRYAPCGYCEDGNYDLDAT